MSFPKNLLPELFLELTTEQQESVAGGANYTEINKETHEFTEHETSRQTESDNGKKDPFHHPFLLKPMSRFYIF
ncbi:MAG: hypothetical protein CLLPBCKN_005877 [Chroococcidiopsis cubana SAG 39.79]|uniref:Bacteriocin n=1 Tax=Chroococcidiopsis cubana SAG 39.79 TaxID=388085 RepID=A0AB37UAG5_9CYAN|nr:hypothetical protein [Chroococcidiopsis cubana]MDZ4876457.1 hypothetical protein [Chroococcidiopsis cubana SAG 39.79]PSB57858.1 hypothetical protein C7B79_30520 [Chroococcidiopsis cubana CCALA 043]RUT01399.1 hypothetical protein DSM107010_65570 [Chroococcidiopsis cubana SAG 39.79]